MDSVSSRPGGAAGTAGCRASGTWPARRARTPRGPPARPGRGRRARAGRRGTRCRRAGSRSRRRARTLRDQSDWFPNVSGMTKVSPVSRAPAGVTYVRPDRRPTCRICAAIMTCLRPASLSMTGLSTLVSGPMTTATSREGRTTFGSLGVSCVHRRDAFLRGDGTGKDGTAGPKVTGSAELGGQEAELARIGDHVHGLNLVALLASGGTTPWDPPLTFMLKTRIPPSSRPLKPSRTGWPDTG